MSEPKQYPKVGDVVVKELPDGRQWQGVVVSELLAAIDKTEHIAQKAVDQSKCRYWRDGEPVWQPVDDHVVLDESGEAIVTGPYGLPDAYAAHIAHNDPATVLARCAADRRTVERHQSVDDRVGYRPDHSYGNVDPACAECGGQDSAVPWPCPTLLDRAAAYGITTEIAHG